jgi:hypothetical protein
LICGGIDQAVRAVMRMAKAFPEKEMECFERALDLYSKDDSEEVLATDIYKQYLPRLVAVGDFEKYFSVSSRYVELLVRIEQLPFAHKELLSQVIVNLAQNKIVGAERILQGTNLNVPGFVHSQEFAAADDLIQAINENDAEALKRIVSKPTVTYLNVEIVKLARNIKTITTNPPVARPDATVITAAKGVPVIDTHDSAATSQEDVDALLM